jgi:hypothetical protein
MDSRALARIAPATGRKEEMPMKTVSVAVALLAAACSASAQQVYPPPSSTGGKYVVAVLADGYAANEEWAFDRAINGLIVNGLMADPFYANLGGSFTIIKKFVAAPTSGQSAFGIAPNYDLRKCYIDYDQTKVVTEIEKEVGAIAPVRVVIIGNYEGSAIACTEGMWTWIAAGAREGGGVLEHEFGHLVAGLYDEFALAGNDTFPSSIYVNDHNCSNVFDTTGHPTPVWNTMSWPQPPTNPPGCLYYAQQIVRPYDDCRMYGAAGQFCYVCADAMTKELRLFTLGGPQSRGPAPPTVLAAGFMLQPPPPPVTSDHHLRVVVQLTRAAADAATGVDIRLLSIVDAKGSVVPRYHRIGNYVYAAVDGGNLLAASVLPGDPFQSHSIGGAPAPHQFANELRTTVVVDIPNITRADLKTHAIRLVFYKLGPTFGRLPSGAQADVTPNVVSDLLSSGTTPFIALSADELKKMAGNLP